MTGISELFFHNLLKNSKRTSWCNGLKVTEIFFWVPLKGLPTNHWKLEKGKTDNAVKYRKDQAITKNKCTCGKSISYINLTEDDGMAFT